MDNMNLIKDIKGFEEWEVIQPIHKGWSEDLKFFIENRKGEKFLLRLSKIDYFEKKKLEYENLFLVAELGVNMSKPVSFGICSGGSMVYELLTWLEGKEAIDVLPSLSKEEQYNYGLKAGKILQKMHKLKPQTKKEAWESRYKRKIDIVIKAYKQSGKTIENDEVIIDYIRENESYLKNRPITFQHGDFHLGNMLITPDGDLGIIDFNRSSYGDPWEEYDRFIFTWKHSIDFALGQIHGYFDSNVPDDFFKLMSLYNARNLIASVPWSITFGNQELEETFENIRLVYESYDGFKIYIPNWYR